MMYIFPCFNTRTSSPILGYVIDDRHFAMCSCTTAEIGFNAMTYARNSDCLHLAIFGERMHRAGD